MRVQSSNTSRRPPHMSMSLHQEKKTQKNDVRFRKTVMCSFYNMGRCMRGENCSFAHGDQDLRQKPELRNTRLCSRFFSTGNCRDGAMCPFAHSKDELRQGNSRQMGGFRASLAASPPRSQQPVVSRETSAPEVPSWRRPELGPSVRLFDQHRFLRSPVQRPARITANNMVLGLPAFWNASFDKASPSAAPQPETVLCPDKEISRTSSPTTASPCRSAQDASVHLPCEEDASVTLPWAHMTTKRTFVHVEPLSPYEADETPVAPPPRRRPSSAPPLVAGRMSARS
eukprot:TRINITY_DN18203_c0_g2_i1.p1 TRINITY_DN18203_c0_g2~~TRINITY_DN18203_c0_g2_i1.p1  ORF type:complete len:285 (-),score=39.61 TRINITY_DN18203_c0_g2_i1:226-1080(-)